MDDPFEINFASVSVFSRYAISAARKYVELMEAQISQAQTDLNAAALEEFHRIASPDETDYDTNVGIIDEMFEEDYRPILRFTEVIYVYMIFETHTRRHVLEIQELRNADPDILKKLKDHERKKKRRCGFVDVADTYFRDIDWKLFDSDIWAALREVTELRNCIVHSAGIARDGNYPLIHRLESRKWRGKLVGIKIERYKEKDIGQPIIVHQRFLQFFLDLIDRYFTAIIEKTHATFWRTKGSS